MSQFENNALFWQKLDTLYLSSKASIVRAKGVRHPQYYNLVYPVDYGYLEEGDKEASSPLSFFRGTEKQSSIQAIVVIADILKKETEVKLLVGCTEQEENLILLFLNQTDFQKAILLRRTNEVPNWAVAD